jgi:predicted nucleotidyltransferase
MAEINLIEKKDFEESLNFIVSEFKKIKEILSIVLFGSYLRDDFSVKHSDLDLMIFIDKNKPNEILEYEEKFYKISSKSKVKIHLTFIYKNETKESSLIRYNALKTGKIMFERKKIFFTKKDFDLEEVYLVNYDMRKLSTSKKFIVKTSLTKSKKFSDLVLNYSSNSLIIRKKGLLKLKHYFEKYNINFEIKYEFLFREKKDYDNN